uniref:Entericidin EcnAB n=1 Tax=uncultured Thiotrichaceae bacterium TaxID=298394 RepID=A0A6S6TL26_9GAMM|nr:MAG: Unknown protein [uncultured Thiotrichaceae bacterium]
MYKVMTIFAALFFTMLLAACSTVEGVGKDIKQVGSAIEQEAKEEKKQAY